MKIIVNAVTKEWYQPTISYEDLLQLTDKTGFQTVVFSHSKSYPCNGTLWKGQSVMVSDGMVFCVCRTDLA